MSTGDISPETIGNYFDADELDRVARIIHAQNHGMPTVASCKRYILLTALGLLRPGYVETNGFCITAYYRGPDLGENLRYKVTLSAYGVEKMLEAPPDPAEPERVDVPDVEANPLTDTQRAIVKMFAAENGPNWRQRLLVAWVKETTGPLLTELRRTHGPRWLLGRAV